MTDELPPGWASTSLETFCSFQSGGRLKLTKKDYVDDGVPAFSAAGQDGFVAPCEFESSAVVVSSIGARCGKAFKATGRWTSLANTYLVFPSADACDLNYLWYQLNDERSWERSGSAQPFIKPTSIQDREVRLAPRDEQQRIVSKIDELFSRIDEGERALERVQKLVERYRQSVLKAAVTGELTREWREKNKDNLESGEALLARILKARREAWEKAELEKMKAKGITPANDKWKEKYEEPVSPDTTELPELPQGWTWVSVDQVAVDTLIGLDCGAPEQSADPAGRFPYIKMNNITMDGRVLFDGVVYVVASEAERSRFSVSNGDILFNTRNSKELVGKTGLVVNAPAGALYNNNIMRVRTVTLADPRYLVAHMCEPTFRSRLELVKKATTSVAAVYAKDLFPLALALPPRGEQEQIMSEVDRAVEAAHHMLQELSARVRAAAALRQSILREAFRGGLVPQSPTDEPAAALLERIAAERGTDNAAPKRGRKKKTAA